jgi:O-antigen ligase
MFAVLVLAILLVNAFGASEVSFVVMTVTLFGLVIRGGRRTIALPWQLPAAFGLLTILGLPGFLRHQAYDAFKDSWYVLKPLIEFAFGFALASELAPKRFFRLLLVAGILFSSVYLARVVIEWDTYWALSNATEGRVDATDALRVYFGPGDLLTAMAIVLVLDRDLRAKIFENTERFVRSVAFIAAIVLNSLTIAACQSRTLVATLLVFAGFQLARAPRWVKLSAVTVVSLGVIVVAVGQITPSDGTSSSNRTKNPLEELAFEEYDNPEDINTHWRGFESFLALQEFEGLPQIQQIFGGGFGQMITLDRSRLLGAPDPMDEIPLLHNGYMYVLLKTGVVGLAAFFAVIFLLFRWSLSKRRNRVVESTRPLQLWLASTLTFTTLVIAGFFNHDELRAVIVTYGFLLGLEHRAVTS